MTCSLTLSSTDVARGRIAARRPRSHCAAERRDPSLLPLRFGAHFSLE
jgi:hypothetical protein